MYNVRVERSAGYAGIAFVVVGIIATFLTGITPTTSASSSEITAYLAGMHVRWLIAAWLVFPALAFFLWFIVQLRAFLRLVPGEDDGLPAYMVATGIVAAVFLLIVTLIEVALGSRLAADIAPAALPTLWDLFNAGDALFLMPVAVTIFAASHSARRHGSMPAWAVYWGYFAALTCALSSISIFFRSGFFTLGGAGSLLLGGIPFAIWVILTSLILIGRPRSNV
ncbi:MAG: hypothetical protein JO177_02905 [Candidatus Eremiobacteraeota bacterium]|nr:hypothetical protein [Candidatus Eremiobacteraeota bacterium]